MIQITELESTKPGDTEPDGENVGPNTPTCTEAPQPAIDWQEWKYLSHVTSYTQASRCVTVSERPRIYLYTLQF